MLSFRSRLFNGFLAAWLLLLVGCATEGQSQQLSASNPPKAAPIRTIAIGDIHGDFGNFTRVLQDVGLIDERNRWIGGKATLVQLGDSTDRGPDSRKAIDLLRTLKKQASRAGGKVAVVIGNHEVMNVTGDLRYVHPGEYAAFINSRSQKRMDAYYRQTVAALKAKAPDDQPFILPDNHREKWDKEFPLGYVAHRMAWSPTGEYGKWTLSNQTAYKIHDAVFVHGGISSKYANMSLRELNRRVKNEISNPKAWKAGSIIDDPEGPFWYRGWAQLDETPENEALLDGVLKKLGVSRMVVGHTPLINTILPRFGGKVIVADVGLSDFYGGANAALELLDDQAFAIIAGQRLKLPTSKDGVVAYLEQASTLVDDASEIKAYIKSLRAKPE